MQLLIYPEISHDGQSGFLEGLFAPSLAADIVWDELLKLQYRQHWQSLRILIPPRIFKTASLASRIKPLIFDSAKVHDFDLDYVLIHHGRFCTDISSSVFRDIIRYANADVIAVRVVSRLTAFSETPRVVEGVSLVGISRPYASISEPVSEMTDWPHHLLIRKDLFVQSKMECNGETFQEWLSAIPQDGKAPFYLETGGNVIDLSSESGLLSVLTEEALEDFADKKPSMPNASVRVFGNVLCDGQAKIAADVILAGPAIVCRGAAIGAGAVIKNAVIGPEVAVPAKCVIKNQVFWKQQDIDSFLTGGRKPNDKKTSPGVSQAFRRWHRWSYIHTGKRILDILFSLVVLTICLPIFLMVFVAIEITSPGPLFYRARRQGIYGKDFDCLKFRTMILRADALQDRLRVVNQVDGPQFKILDDPRITGVGKFLRNTCIDEIPQFINVLMGQMSVVGPRPSPEEENRTCPPWRDARLSVRPGITGLWQISRTRQAGMDFQEWVHYDMEYVRKVSFWMDLKICVRTVMHLILQFLAQFG